MKDSSLILNRAVILTIVLLLSSPLVSGYILFDVTGTTVEGGTNTILPNTFVELICSGAGTGYEVNTTSDGSGFSSEQFNLAECNVGDNISIQLFNDDYANTTHIYTSCDTTTCDYGNVSNSVIDLSCNILPVSPNSNDSLIGYINASHMQSKNVSYEWEWYKNGVLYSSSGAQLDDPANYVYQEDSDSYSFSSSRPEVIDGNYSSSSYRFTAYLNYSTPSYATNQSLWQVKDSGATTNLSLSSCWNESVIQLKIESNDDVFNRIGEWSCYNGNSWVALRSSSTEYTIFEEGIYWANETLLYVTPSYWNPQNISSTYTSKDEEWGVSCYAVDEDGNATETIYSANYTINDLTPIMNSTRITQETTGTNELLGFCSANDSDTATLGYNYHWFKEGVSQLNNNITSWCYQDNANESSSCGGLSDGSYEVFGDITYATYYKPVWVNGSVQLELNTTHYDELTNVSFLDECLNEETLKYYYYSTSTLTASHIYFYCYNGTDYVEMLHTTGDFGGVTIHESVWWGMIGNYSQGTEQQLQNLSNSLTTKGDNWTLSCSAYDTGSWSDAINVTYEVLNYPVQATNISYLNNSAGHKVFFQATSLDYDSYTDVTSFYANASSGTCEVTGNESSSYELNGTIFCSGTPSVSADINITFVDGSGATATTTTLNAIYSNIAPNITDVFVADIGSALNCTYVYSDDDNDSESASYFNWYKNGSSLGITTQTLGIGNYSLGGDEMICNVISFDGYENSSSTNSSTFITGDYIAPTLSEITYSASVYTDQVITISAMCTDANPLASNYPRVSWINPNGITEGAFIMTDVGNDTFERTYTFSIVGTYTNFSFSCKDGSGNEAVEVGNNVSVSVRPVESGGGGGAQPSDNKKDCNIVISPESVLLSTEGGLKEVKIQNDDVSSFNPEFRFITVDEEKDVTEDLFITNPIVSLLQGQSSSFGVKYEPKLGDAFVSTKNQLVLTSQNCKDITINIVISEEVSSNILDLFDGSLSLLELIKEPIFKPNSEAYTNLSLISIGLLFFLTLLGSYIILFNQITNSFKERKYFKVTAWIIFMFAMAFVLELFVLVIARL